MITLLLAVILGIGFALFASQNTAMTMVQFGESFLQIPIYLIALGFLMLGIFLAGILSLMNQLSSAATLWNRESALKKTNATVVDLKHAIAKLEAENEELREDNRHKNVENLKGRVENTKQRATNFFQRLRHSV